MASTIMRCPDLSSALSAIAVGDSSDNGNPGATEALLASNMANINDDSTATAESFMANSNSPNKSPPTFKVTHGFSMSVPIPAHVTTKIEASSSPCNTTKRLNDVPSSIFEAASSSSHIANHSNALDALATLASSAHNRLAATTDDSHTMPPPPNRRVNRVRSASNPEGMEKWDSYLYNVKSNRMHFVLPSSILEEELASATDACEAYEKQKLGLQYQRPVRKTVMTDFSIQSQPQVDCEGLYGTSPTTVMSSLAVDGLKNSRRNTKATAKKQTSRKKSATNKRGQNNAKSSSESNASEGDDNSFEEENENEQEEEEIDESDLEPEELLKRARSRLFEDLSAENGLEKGALAMPHSLEKYKEIYNKNGRIGVYTPAERAAIIAKFNSKRTRRTWKKKIRYNCRKSLADRRMRVKGRFVKRAVEQNKKETETPESSPVKVVSADIKSLADASPALESEDNSSTSSSSDSSRTASPIPIAPPSGPLAPVIEEDTDVDADGDVDMGMPDVMDPDAGFKPTASQPYRRTRRHTIT